jgi:hypothetical protein
MVSHIGEAKKIITASITPLNSSNNSNSNNSNVTTAMGADGSTHFFTHPAREPTGTTLFKRRLLDLAVQRGKVSGWVCVPYWEWGACKGESERRAYIRELLKAKGLSVEGLQVGAYEGAGGGSAMA